MLSFRSFGFMLALFRAVRKAARLQRSRYARSINSKKVAIFPRIKAIHPLPIHNSHFELTTRQVTQGHSSIITPQVRHVHNSPRNRRLGLCQQSIRFRVLRNIRSATPQKYYPSVLAAGAPT